MHYRFNSRWICLFVLFLFFAVSRSGAAAEAWRGKVQPEVLEDVAAGSADFLIFLDAQADLSGAAALKTKAEKGRFVFEKLTDAARTAQAPIIAELDRAGIKYKPLWVADMIAATGDAALIERLARRTDVRGVFTDRLIRLEEPIRQNTPAGTRAKTAAIEWNITQVNAPSVWALGDTGQGAVVGGIDTGYDWSHPAIINQYRGWNGSTADHNYNWHDAIHTGSGGSCGLDSPVPCDDHGHGTHTMGTMVGDDLAGNQVGMAPGAKWIGCRCMDVGNGTPATYTECLQWMIAPTDLNDLNPDPLLAPDVINNSWGCPASEGCTDPLVLQTVVDNVRAAGIVVVASAGNSGPSCSTVDTPIATYDGSYSIGATDASDQIAWFSSRGNVTVDGSGRMKPDVSAPGVGVRSSIAGGGYTSLSGTSMAGPHVAGLVALLVAANPALAGDVTGIENIINQSALPLTTTETCGGVPAGQVPNNTFGYGRIDALAAYNLSTATGVASPGIGVPAPAALLSNRPNPFNPTTVIDYTLPASAGVTLRVYDVAGRQVKELVRGEKQSAGSHSVTWDGIDASGRAAPSGVYFYRLQANDYDSTRRMTLVR